MLSAFTLDPVYLPPLPTGNPDERFAIFASAEDIAALPPKARGEVAEARFLAKALELGFVVCKPFGDSAKFDFIVQAGKRLSRVQVKSAWVECRERQGCYQFGASPARTDADGIRPYRRDEIDFLIAYVAPEGVWYVVPVGVVLKKNHLQFTTADDDPMARYKEAWTLLHPITRKGGA